MNTRIAAFGLAILALLAAVPRVQCAEPSDYQVGYEYTLRYYPRWFTWTQHLVASSNAQDGGGNGATNRIAGPLGMGPEYKIVVAINDDTVYAQSFLDLSQGPQVLTLQAYQYIYSILQLDVYGSVFSSPAFSPAPKNGGSFVLTGPDYKSELPPPFNDPTKFTRVNVPYNSSEIILRVDRHTPTGEDITKQATEFRASMMLQSLGKYNPECTAMSCGRAFVAPLYAYSAPVKRMADMGLTFAPEGFLDTLQMAMASPTTAPLTASDQELIAQFNAHFNAAKKEAATNSLPLTDILRGAQAAHVALINRWQSNRGETGWIHFDNIGNWGTNYLDRAALTEYIQYGNNSAAAFYADAFVDDSNIPLNGKEYDYTIRFDRDHIPKTQRFWSITAYTPEDIELVPNAENKYLVASYTPNLQTAADGSITIYISAKKPADPARQPNWLPVPEGMFSLLFRNYGPEGDAAKGTYLVPKIHREPLK